MHNGSVARIYVKRRVRDNLGEVCCKRRAFNGRGIVRITNNLPALEVRFNVQAESNEITRIAVVDWFYTKIQTKPA